VVVVVVVVVEGLTEARSLHSECMCVGQVLRSLTSPKKQRSVLLIACTDFLSGHHRQMNVGT